MTTLDIVCPCGHAACYHPDREQQAAYSKDTNGHYQAECKGFDGIGMPSCRCITSREEVMEDRGR